MWQAGFWFKNVAAQKSTPRASPGCCPKTSRGESCLDIIALGDGDFWAEVDVLDRVQELDAFFHGALEGFAAGDEAGAAGALVDDGGGARLFEVFCSGADASFDS